MSGAYDYLAMFVSSFVAVFLLGMQSRNVNAGRYVSAVITSAGISGSQFMFAKYASTGSYDVFLATASGGCIGVAASIYIYTKYFEKNKC